MKNYQNDHPQIPRPLLNGYGTSFGDYGGDSLLDYSPPGEIDAPKLNRLTLEDAGEFSEFETVVKDYVLGMLGFPVVRVELTPFQLKHCVQEGINKLNYHAPLWNLQYASFDASAGQNIYEIPLYMLHNLEYVAYRKNLLTIAAQAGTLEFDFFLKYFQDNFLFGNMRVGDFYLMQQTLEQYRKILSADGGFNIVGGKYLQIYPSPAITPERVILEYRAIDSNTIQPAYLNWIQRYALAVAKGVLSQVRGKFSSVPSPAGGAMLNGAQLAQESEKEKELLSQELLNEIEEPPAFSTY
jgi:hypothetical protein|tara:strand:+ start:24280 stop:25170 length:891 start_codon:yes stop_codon:yes gene_type:complete